MRKLNNVLALGVLLAIASAGANDALPPNRLSIVFGDQECTAKINLCQLMPSMVAVAGESDSEPERIKVMFRKMGGKSVFTLELIYVLDGVKRRENWDADNDMIVSSSIDGKLVTAEGKIHLARVRTMPNGLWEEHANSESEASQSFSLTARCPKH
jgi:hypothetical protein